MNYSIGMDIGTTTVKCELFRQDLSSAAEAFREYRTVTPRPSWAEQDPWDWWRCAVSCIREVIGKSGARAQDIKVISVSGQAPCALPVDRNGDPLCWNGYGRMRNCSGSIGIHIRPCGRFTGNWHGSCRSTAGDGPFALSVTAVTVFLELIGYPPHFIL